MSHATPSSARQIYRSKRTRQAGDRHFRVGPTTDIPSSGRTNNRCSFVRDLPPERAEGLAKPSLLIDPHGYARPITPAKQGRNVMRTSSLAGAFVISLLVATALTPVRAADMTNERTLNPQR